MAKLSIKAGSTSKTAKIFVPDSSSSTGAGLTGLVFNTSSLSTYYIKEGDATATAISLVTATLGTWTSGGFKVVDGTNMPGLYEIGIPNSAIASGKSVVIYLFGAANMTPTVLEIELTAVDNQSATGFVSSVPAVVGAVGSVTGAVASVTGNVGGNVTGSVGSVSNISAQTGDSYARLGAPVGASISADIATLTAALLPGTITGTVGASPTIGDFITNLTGGAIYAKMFCVMLTGSANAGLARPISTSSGSPTTLNFSDTWPILPVAGDTFVLVGYDG